MIAGVVSMVVVLVGMMVDSPMLPSFEMRMVRGFRVWGLCGEVVGMVVSGDMDGVSWLGVRADVLRYRVLVWFGVCGCGFKDLGGYGFMRVVEVVRDFSGVSWRCWCGGLVGFWYWVGERE